MYNLGPCPLPGGKLAFVSDRNAFKAINPGYAPNALALQLFVMDDDGGNVECIGHLNLGMALHPVILKDGRIMFSSLESQGLRSHHLWGVWSIHPDGTNWGPLFSAFEIGNGTADSTHFQTQLSDEQHRRRDRTTTSTTSASAPTTSSRSQPPDGLRRRSAPATSRTRATRKLRHGRHADGRADLHAVPVQPVRHRSADAVRAQGRLALASRPIPSKKDSPRVGKFTHPSAAPDNHLLTVWSAGSRQQLTRSTSRRSTAASTSSRAGKPSTSRGRCC